MNNKQPSKFIVSLIIGIFFLLHSFSYGQVNVVKNTTNTPPQGTSKVWGVLEGISITGLVEGPATADSQLQIACVFEYTENDIYNSPPALPAAVNGLVHLDQALKGQLTQIRKNNYFSGHIFETFLITPPSGTLKSDQLLLIGLGDRNLFSPEIMIEVGKIAMREALKLGVENFSIASDLKDAGIDSPTALIPSDMLKGIISEYRVQKILKGLDLVEYSPISQVYLLSGSTFFYVAGEGILETIATLEKE